MYHQFMELAERRHHQGADGGRPDLPLRHGWRRGRPRLARLRSSTACTPPARCSGGMHGSNRLGGNSLSDLLVFGKRAGESAALRATTVGRARRSAPTSSPQAEAEALAPFEPGGENPYTVWAAAAGRDAGAGRHHPQRRGGPAGPHASSRTSRPSGSRRRAAGLQPGLAPRHRHAEHAAGLGVHREGGDRARGEPGRPHPRRVPRPVARVGRAEPGLHAERRRRDHLTRKPLPQMPDELKQIFEEAAPA